ncbi:hypothetical protein GF367_02525 [Candidatus Woesearchaeota archaeon]|nr:hypothetical protein [Candidatus Woesearchaeota archaeon]
MKRFALLGLVALALVLSGCQYLGLGPTGNETDLTGQVVIGDEDFVFLNETEDAAEDMVEEEAAADVGEEDITYTMRVVEGDLVKIDLEAIDPDGDAVEYEFTEPINPQGRWQTQIGDEGSYLVTVTASDGKLATSEDVLVVVERANRAPIIECPETLTIKEGELLVIDCNIYDEEGDSILVSYEGWTTSSSKRTTYDDAGEYTILVRATDSKKMSTQTLDVVVENVNRAPEMEPINDLTVMETAKVSVEPKVTDPDGDELSLSFTSPLGDGGEWQTTDGDAGTYDISVVASDGSATDTEDFTITVTQINTAPVLKPIRDISVDEGDTIRIPVNAYDPEGDELTVSFSGFMDGEEYTASYDDAGEYEQTVTVSDGVLTISETFTITVENKNRPPEFIIPEE